jgi:hypothetical protein
MVDLPEWDELIAQNRILTAMWASEVPAADEAAKKSHEHNCENRKRQIRKRFYETKDWRKSDG